MLYLQKVIGFLLYGVPILNLILIKFQITGKQDSLIPIAKLIIKKSSNTQNTKILIHPINSMEKNTEEFINSVFFVSSQFDNFNNKIDNTVNKLKNIKLVNEKIIAKNKL